jgi:hypothetical protein
VSHFKNFSDAAWATVSRVIAAVEQEGRELTVYECELSQRALMHLLREFWAQQRTSILTRATLGTNFNRVRLDDGDEAYEFMPGLDLPEKATFLRKEPTDLRKLQVPEKIDYAVQFHVEEVKPILLANRHRHSASASATPREDDDANDKKALFLTRGGRRIRSEDIRVFFAADFFYVTGFAMLVQDIRRNMCAFLYSSQGQDFGPELNALRYLMDHHPIVAQTYYAPITKSDMPTKHAPQREFLQQFSAAAAAVEAAGVSAPSSATYPSPSDVERREKRKRVIIDGSEDDEETPVTEKKRKKPEEGETASYRAEKSRFTPHRSSSSSASSSPSASASWTSFSVSQSSSMASPQRNEHPRTPPRQQHGIRPDLHPNQVGTQARSPQQGRAGRWAHQDGFFLRPNWWMP